jgi:hypothetical protein
MGLTIICAGRGFGPDGRWGLALGADQWAPDFTVGADMLLSAVAAPAPAPRSPAGAPQRIDEVRLLRREHHALVEDATRTAFASWPMLRDSEEAMRATREDLAATLRVIASATLVDDLALVADYVKWFEAVLVSHGYPPAFVTSAFELLLGVLPAELACARDAARSGHDACSGPGLGQDHSR